MSAIRKLIPKPVKVFLKTVWYRLGFRPEVKGETAKAKERRVREGFFEKYCNGYGLDIGFGGDLLTPDCRGFDFEHGDAHYLKREKDHTYDFVYSSHTLEHLPDERTALRNWWRVLKPGGYLIIYLPHRDLYEKKKELPSRFNPTHVHFFLPEKDEKPDTIGVRQMLEKTLDNAKIIYVKECSEGHTLTDPHVHSDGEYSIEAVVKKLS